MKSQFITLLLSFFISLDGRIIMLSPAGDARNAGRVIDNTFERSLALQCCNELQKRLSHTSPNIEIVLTRFPGETIEPLQNAQFANRLNTDLFISIYVYQTDTPKPSITIYQYIAHPTDLWHTPHDELEFINIDNAHLSNAQQTNKLGKALLAFFQRPEYHPQLTVHNFLTLPLKPLFGIQAPALGIEMGIAYKEQWHSLIPIIIEGIQHVLNPALS